MSKAIAAILDLTPPSRKERVVNGHTTKASNKKVRAKRISKLFRDTRLGRCLYILYG